MDLDFNELCDYCLKNKAVTEHDGLKLCATCYVELSNSEKRAYPKWLRRTVNQVRCDFVDLINGKVIELKYRIDLKAFGQLVVYSLLLERQFNRPFEKYLVAEDILLNRREIWHYVANKLGINLILVKDLYDDSLRINYEKVYQLFGRNLRREFPISIL